MFTGIVALAAEVASADVVEGIMKLRINTPLGFNEGLETGASVSVNGCCLTVVKFSDSFIDFDVIDESLSRTNLGALVESTRVNLERAARFGDEIGGHMLSGHIHTTAEITQIRETEANVSMELRVEDAWVPYIISKGYIAINGCSLTIGATEENRFWLHLIPETLRITNLMAGKIGSHLNVEIDHQTQVIVETVERVLAKRSAKLGS